MQGQPICRCLRTERQALISSYVHAPVHIILNVALFASHSIRRQKISMKNGRLPYHQSPRDPEVHPFLWEYNKDSVRAQIANQDR